MRKVLRWVFWSPRNAMVTAGVAAALVITGFAVSASGPADSATSAATDGPTSTPSATTSTTTAPKYPNPKPWGDATTVPTKGGERDAVPTAPARSASAADTAARAFMAAWLRGRTTDHAQWITTMKPLIAPQLLPYLDMTPASAIPNTTVRSWSEPAAGNDYATVQLLLADKTKLELEVVVWNGRWVVAHMDEKA